MDDKIQQRWLELGYDEEKIPTVVEKLAELQYDAEKVTSAASTDVYALFGQHLGGLVLFSGRVTAKNVGFTVVLEDERMCVTTAKVDEERSLYINPLEKRIREEHIRLNGIKTNDIIYIGEKVIGNLDTFHLFIEDARKNQIASFEFWKQGGMLYVPKRLQE